MAVATSFGGTATQAIWASTAASSQTMAPWAVWWFPTKSRRSCGQRTVASGAVAECTGCSGRVRVCSRKGIGCCAAASPACSSSEAVGSPIRRVSSLHQAFPEPPRDDPCNRVSHSCHHSEWARRPCCGDQPIASQSCRDGGRMRGAPEETDQISFPSPSPDMPGVDQSTVRVGAGALSPVRSHADSHRPGKFSCPEVESLQPIVQTLYNRIVKWCKSVGARCGHRGVRVGEATNPVPPKRLHLILASVSQSTNRFEILSSEDELEVFTTVPAFSGAVRAVQEACESQAPRGQRISEVANSVRSSRRRWTQRLRALPWSLDSDTESADERNVARRVESQGTVVESVDDEQSLGRVSTLLQGVWSKEAPNCSRFQIIKRHHRTFWTPSSRICWKQRVHHVHCRGLWVADGWCWSHSRPEARHDLCTT